MPTLTGRLAYVTGALVPASAIRQITVAAPRPRPGSTPAALIGTRPVHVDATGTLTVDLDPGRAVLTAHIDAATTVVDLLVEPGMTTIHQSALAALADRR